MYRLFYPCMLALLAVSFCFPLRTNAQHKSFSISPAPQWLVPYKPDLQKTPDLREISNGYYIRLFEEQYHAERKSQYRHVVRQIVSEAGVQNGAEISVDYDPAYEQLKFHQLVVRRNGTVINQLSAGRFRFLQQEKELSRFIYSGLYTAYFIVDDVRKGDQIEYAYTLEGHNPIFEDKYFNTFYFGAGEPVMNFYKALIASPSRKLQFKAFNKAPLPLKKTLQGMTLYEWNLVQLTNPREEDYATPSWYSTYPFVQVTEYTRWEEIVNWAVQVNTIQNAMTPALQSKVDAWLKEGAGNKTAYLQSAVRFVQDDIRYMGIEMGEYSHRPSQPGKILTQRFGDCKDKSLLLCTLLRAAGIEANVAYVNTDAKGTITDYLPSPVMFDHVIVNASLDGKTYWIDPTINYQRGLITSITVPDYQKALVISTGNGAFSEIPQNHTGTTRITETFTLPADNKKPGKLEVFSSYQGQYADEIRANFAESSLKELQQSYVDYYKDIYGSVTADSAVQFYDVDNGPDVLEVVEKYALHQPWTIDSTDRNKQHFYIRAKILTDLLPVIDADTFDAPLALKYPYSLDYTLTFEMPEEWSFDDADLHLKNKYYRLDFTSAVYGHTVKLHYQYTSYQDHIPAEDLAAYRNDRNEISENASFTFNWNKGLNTSKPAGGGSGVSWILLVLALLFVGIFSYIATKFYERSVLPVKHYQDPWNIGGWLALMGFGVMLSPLVILVQTIDGGFLANTTWEAYIRAENSQPKVLLLIAEVAANAFLWVYSILLLILFVKRRDTFPAACIVYYAATGIIQMLDLSATSLLDPSIKWSGETVSNFGRTAFAAAIWIPYLLKSERVRHTFVVPHPSALQ
ncbi:MAG TPA: DUF3857 domain-containing protein [Chitinophaga sp.]